jgi:hypothetical protein
MDISLTEHDYENMRYIVKHKEILNSLIRKYSSLNIVYPDFTCEDIHNIPTCFSLQCTCDHINHTIQVDPISPSSQASFVLLYMQTLELVQICIDIFNEFERGKKDEPMIPLKNGVAFVSMDRNLKNIPHSINPHTWNTLIGDKNCSAHHAHL